MKLHAKLTGLILISYILFPVVEMLYMNSTCRNSLLNSPNYDIYCLGKFDATQVIIRWENSSPQIRANLTYCLEPDSDCSSKDKQGNTEICMHCNGTQMLLNMHRDHIISCTYASNGIHELIISITMEVTHVMYANNVTKMNYAFPNKVNDPKFSNIIMRNAACIGLFYRQTEVDKGNKPVCKVLQSSDQLSDFIKNGYKLANPDKGERNTNNDCRSQSPKDSGGTIKDTFEKKYELTNPNRRERLTNNNGPTTPLTTADAMGAVELRSWLRCITTLLSLILTFLLLILGILFLFRIKSVINMFHQFFTFLRSNIRWTYKTAFKDDAGRPENKTLMDGLRTNPQTISSGQVNLDDNITGAK